MQAGSRLAWTSTDELTRLDYEGAHRPPPSEIPSRVPHPLLPADRGSKHGRSASLLEAQRPPTVRQAHHEIALQREHELTALGRGRVVGMDDKSPTISACLSGIVVLGYLYWDRQQDTSLVVEAKTNWWCLQGSRKLTEP